MNHLTKIPVNHRILLHLHSYHKYRSHFEIPFALTQRGIAENVFIHRAAAARSLNEMKEKELVVSETRHVVRGNRKRKVYFLTDKGFEASQEIGKHLLESSIVLIEKGSCEEKTTSLCDLVSKKRDGLSLLAVCNHLQNGVLDLNITGEGKSTIEKTSIEKTHTPRKEFYFSPQIPHIPHFTGREEELKRIKDMINQGQVSGIVLQGLAGIGKTSLAAQVAHEFIDQQDVFWLEIHPWTQFQSFVSRLFGFLLERPEERRKMLGPDRDEKSEDSHQFEELLNQALSALSQRRVLMILDDTHNASKKILDFMRALIIAMKQARDAVFLMTSRTMPDFYDRRVVAVEKRVVEFTLSGLNFDESLELVNTLKQTKRKPGKATPELAEDISEDFQDTGDDLPIPKLLTREEFEIVYDETRGHPFSLELLSSMNLLSAQLDFQRFLNEEIFERLPPKERSVLLFCSIFRLPLHIQPFLELIPDNEVTRHHVEQLIQKNLLRDQGGVLSLHSLIKDFAESRLSRDMNRHYHESAVGYYTWLVKKAEERGMNGKSQGEIAGSEHERKREDEHQLIVEQIYHHLKAGQDERAVNIIMEMADELISYGSVEFYDVLQLLDMNNVNEEQRDDMLEILGDAHAEFGRLDEAFEHYLAKLEQETGDSLGKARLLQKMGDIEKEKGDIDSSIAFKKKSLFIFQKKKDLRESAKVFNELALDYWKKNELENARQAFLKAQKLLERAGQTHGLSHVLLNLARLESEEGEMKKATSFLEKSLSAASTEHERIQIFHTAGDFALKKGENHQALEWYRNGLETARKETALREMMFFLKKCADLCIEMKNDEGALETLVSGLAFIQDISGKDGKKVRFSHPSHLSQGSFPFFSRKQEEMEQLSQSANAGGLLTKKQETMRRENYFFATLCETTARLFQEIENHEEAILYYEKSTKIYRSFRDIEKAAAILLQIGNIQLEKGEQKKAALVYREACNFFEAEHNAKGAAIALLNLAGVLEQVELGRESLKHVIRLYRRAHECAKQAGFTTGIEIAAKKLTELDDDWTPEK